MKISIHLTYLVASLSFNGILAKEGGTPIISYIALARATSLSSKATVTNNKKTVIIGKKNKYNKPAFFSNSISVDTNSIINTVPRGGACSDSNPALFAKITATAVAESVVLLGVLLTSVKLSETTFPGSSMIPSIYNLPLLELVASFMVIFGSSFFGAYGQHRFRKGGNLIKVYELPTGSNLQ
jgi:hypothetical protein